MCVYGYMPKVALRASVRPLQRVHAYMYTRAYVAAKRYTYIQTLRVRAYAHYEPTCGHAKDVHTHALHEISALTSGRKTFTIAA